jgi:hypothetical protein
VLARGDEWPEALVELRRRYPRYDTMRLEDLPMLVLEPRRVVSWRWGRT